MSTKAKESPQIQKARKKIKRQLQAADKRINPETLAAMRQLIKLQLARHQPERIALKSRQVTIFDENQHPAKTESRFVTHLLQQLQQGEDQPSDNDLEGRISSISGSGT